MAEQKKRILLDVDGTITIGPGPSPELFAPVQNGARAFLGGLRDRGYEIIIFSARSDVGLVKKFFREQDMDRFVDGYTRTKKPAKVIIDDRSIQFRGSFEQTLRELDQFVPYWDRVSKASCLMAILPADLAADVRAIGAAIPDSDLNKDGREEESHVTIKWGIHGDDSSGARRAIQGRGKVSVKIGALSLFELPDKDVLKIDVESQGLMDLNAAVNRECPHIDTFPDYHPHITVAYLKPGMGSAYVRKSDLEGKDFLISRAVFSDRTGAREEIVL